MTRTSANLHMLLRWLEECWDLEIFQLTCLLEEVGMRVRGRVRWNRSPHGEGPAGEVHGHIAGVEQMRSQQQQLGRPALTLPGDSWQVTPPPCASVSSSDQSKGESRPEPQRGFAVTGESPSCATHEVWDFGMSRFHFFL